MNKIRCQSNTDRYEAKNVVASVTPMMNAKADTTTKLSLMPCNTWLAVSFVGGGAAVVAVVLDVEDFGRRPGKFLGPPD